MFIDTKTFKFWILKTVEEFGLLWNIGTLRPSIQQFPSRRLADETETIILAQYVDFMN